MQKKTIFIITAVLLASVAITLVVIDALKNAHLNILVTPLDAKVYINNKEYKNGSYRLFPGEVSVKIEHSDMKTEEFSLSLTSNHTESLHIYLVNGSKEDPFSYYRKNLADYEALKLVGKDEKAEKFINEIEQLLSIRDALPITSFSASSTPSSVNGMMGKETIIKDATADSACEYLICLSLLDNTGSLDTAAALLKSYGFDMEKYQIINESY